MRAATIAALFGEGILVTLNATKLIMYWGGGYAYYNSISYHESVHKHEEISKYFLCIFRNEIPLFANIKLNLLFIYNNFLQYSTKNTNFVLVKILFMKKKTITRNDIQDNMWRLSQHKKSCSVFLFALSSDSMLYIISGFPFLI